MRILQVLPELNIGGVERGTIDLALALKERGHIPFVISHGGIWVKILEDNHISHIQMSVHSKNPLHIYQNSRKLRNFILNEKIDIVHARSRVPAWAAYLATRHSPARFLTTAHGYYSTHWGSQVMGWGERVICVSKHIEKHMQNQFKVWSAITSVIHRGVEIPSQWMHYQKELRPFENWKIGNVGRLTPIKGQWLFIQNMKNHLKIYPKQKIILIGSAHSKHSAYQKNIEEWIDQNQLDHQIELLGHQDPVFESMADLDVLVVSTIMPEAFGRVIVEAQLMGIPVIAPDIGGISEIIDHDKTGLLFKEGDLKEVPRLLNILKDKEVYLRIRQNAKKKAQEEFNLKQMVDKTMGVYEELLKTPRVMITKYGALGDLVLASASLREIKKEWPKSELYLVTDPKFEDIARHMKADKIIPFSRKNEEKNILGMLKWILKARRLRTDISIDFQNNHRSHWCNWLTQISKRFGLSRKIAKPFLTQSASYASLLNQKLNPVRQQFEILKMLSLHPEYPSLEFEITSDMLDKAECLLKDLFSGKSYTFVAMHIGSSMGSLSRRWPIEYFIQLSDLIFQKHKLVTVFVGGAEDQVILNNVGELKQYQYSLIGKTDIPLLAAILKKAKLFMGNDSGPMYVAHAVQIPVITCYGPTLAKNRFPEGLGQALQLTLPCSPCYEPICPLKHHACMKELNPEFVYEAVNTWLCRPT